MDLKVGDELLEPSTGSVYKIVQITNHYLLWDALSSKNEWIPVLIIQFKDDVIKQLKRRTLVPNTEAGRLFYENK